MKMRITLFTVCCFIELLVARIIRNGSGFQFVTIYLLFSSLAAITPFAVHLVSLNPSAAKYQSLIISPFIIFLAFTNSCRGNPEAMMWYPIAGFNLLLLTSPIWGLSSIFMFRIIRLMSKFDGRSHKNNMGISH